MSLITCRECRREISSEATSCPHCGCPSPAPAPQVAEPAWLPPIKSAPASHGSGLLLILGGGVALVIAVAVFSGSDSRPSQPPASPHAPVAAQSRETIVAEGFHPACQSIEHLNRIVELAGEGDGEAIADYFGERSQCIRLLYPLKVEVEDASRPGLIRLRLKGDETQYWAFSDAVK